MKVVGLLSGGKDSVYNLLHCIVNGHEPVAVASLGPPEGKDELDSYMYQTVGHSGLASIASALGLPLFTHEIKGKAVEMGGEYGSRSGAAAGQKSKGGLDGDETEDLYELLNKVKTAMPDVQGVACGAILSNYQRVRVEHVCARLGLTPIAYLWERPQPELLREMVVAGMESWLVKVAGAGLQVEYLGKSLAEMEVKLHQLNAKYQLHVCGEGGEYETFTVDCPLFKYRVSLDKTTTIITDPSPYSTIAHLHLDTCSLAPKPNYPTEETLEQTKERLMPLVGVPPVLDWKSEKVLKAAREGYAATALGVDGLSLDDEQPTAASSLTSSFPRPTSERVDEWLYFGEVLAPSSLTEAEMSIEEEVRACFAALEALLATHSATLLSLSHLTVYLSSTSMSHFPRINAIYSTYFGTSPPTRACVSILGLPSSRRLKLEGIACLPLHPTAPLPPRTCLHVQSLSYWAPANIGPYSQGITSASQRLFVAGQIPLLPATLTLPQPEDFALEAALSLQHVRRAKVAATEGRWRGWCEGGVCWIGPTGTNAEWKRRVGSAERAWRAFERGFEAEEEEDEDDEEVPRAPMLFVQAEQLPRGAGVEWQVTFATGIKEGGVVGEDASDSDDDGVPSSRRAEPWSVEKASPASRVDYQCCKSAGVSKVAVAILACSTGETTRHALPSLGQIHSIKAFHLPTVSLEQVHSLASTTLGIPVERLPALSTVGVGRISTSATKEGQHEVAFVITASVLKVA